MNIDLGATAVILGVYVLAVARVTLLINTDRITDPIRVFVAARAVLAQTAANESAAAGQEANAAGHERRAKRWDLVSYLLGCPWCVSMWITLGTAWLPLHHADNRWVQYICIALAASYLVGLLSRLTEDEDAEIVADQS
jgi:hypothetical protein